MPQRQQNAIGEQNGTPQHWQGGGATWVTPDSRSYAPYMTTPMHQNMAHASGGQMQYQHTPPQATMQYQYGAGAQRSATVYPGAWQHHQMMGGVQQAQTGYGYGQATYGQHPTYASPQTAHGAHYAPRQQQTMQPAMMQHSAQRRTTEEPRNTRAGDVSRRLGTDR